MRDINNIAVDKDEMLRYLGYGGQEITQQMDSEINLQATRCQELAHPKYVYNLYRIEVLEDAVELRDAKIRFRGGDIRGHLSGASECAVMAVTLGMDVERELLRLEFRSMTQALFFNAACTALIESAADACEEDIRTKAKERGFHINFRYSPGYGDFPLEQQPELLALTDAGRKLGITLTDGGLMVPRKSVTAVIGLFHQDFNEPKPMPACENCPRYVGCELRKTGGHCGR